MRWKINLENLLRDFRYAFRNLRKDRRFAFIAIFALALGIGASTVVFSVVYNVFFHALPYKNFNRSVVFEMRNLESVGGWKSRSSPSAMNEDLVAARQLMRRASHLHLFVHGDAQIHS
jgi:hypothetical protein